MQLTPNLFQQMSHYGNPAQGCRSDEVAGRIGGANGQICLPSCRSGQCPSDVPQGTTATPMCVIQDQSGHQYCGLICSGIATGTCPQGASCMTPSNAKFIGWNLQAAVGICLFP